MKRKSPKQSPTRTRKPALPQTFLDDIEGVEPSAIPGLVASMFATREVHVGVADVLGSSLHDRPFVKKKQSKRRKSKNSVVPDLSRAFQIAEAPPTRPDLGALLESAARTARLADGGARLLMAMHSLGVATGPALASGSLLGWSLSGGGAKGSFQAGAIRYLASRWKDFAPMVVAGTSVGSVNAIGVCQWGPNAEDRIPELWLNRLKVSSDMYVPSKSLEELDQALKPTGTSVDKIIKGGLSLPSGQLVPDWGYLLANLIVPGVGSLIVDAIVNGIAVGVLKDILDKVAKLERVYSLEPARTILREELGTMDPRTKLRMVTVSMLTGKPYFVDEHARALEFDVQQPRSSYAAQYHLLGQDHTDALIRGAIASATIPIIFGCEPVWLSNSDAVQSLGDAQALLSSNAKAFFKTVEFHQMVDGGIRDVLPLHAAVDAGATSVIAVSASARGIGRAQGFGLKLTFGGPATTVAEQIPRLIDVLVNEVSEADRLEGRAAAVTFIEPLQNVHDLMTIDPGLIRINLDYGYMRAFDACDPMPADVAAGSWLMKFLWAVGVVATAEELTSLRSQVFRLEEQAVKKWAGVILEKGTIKAIRSLKRKIHAQAKLRADLWRQSRSLPLTLPGGLAVQDWWLSWERHSAVTGVLLSSPGGPWSQHYVDDNGVIALETPADVGPVPPSTI